MSDEASAIRRVDVAIPAHDVAHCIGTTLDAVLAQELPVGVALRIYIADDGSGDGLQEFLYKHYRERVELAVHEQNLGRSAACNTAISLGDGDIVIVLDADCRFADSRMVRRMLNHFDADIDAVLGTVEAEGSGFWATYAKLVSARRLAAARTDGHWHMTTANFAIRRRILTELGAFSTEYKHYGFEDRDLLLRLARTDARVTVDPDIIVLHREPAAVGEVCRKLYQSGRHTAQEFATRFPEEYRRSPYHRFDLSNRHILSRVLSPLLDLICPLSERLSEALISRHWLPFGLKAFGLRVTSALAYVRGTCHSASK